MRVVDTTIEYRVGLGDVLDQRLHEAIEQIRELKSDYLAVTAQAKIVDAEMERIDVVPLEVDFGGISSLHEPRTY